MVITIQSSKMVYCDIIDKWLSRTFRKIGQVIGLYPGYFVVIPVLVSIIFATGLQRIHYEDDPEYLFSPIDGRSKSERSTIDTLFPMNYSTNFNLGRITHKGRFGRVIVVPNDGGSVLRSHIFDEIIKLNDAIRNNITINYDDENYNFINLCAKMDGNCLNNDILDFKDKILEIEQGKFSLQYPLYINRDIFKAYFFPANLGGVITDENNLVTNAQAINLMFFLDVTKKRGDLKASLWEDAFIKYMETYPLQNITVAKFISSTLRTELESNTQSLVPFFSITVIIMIVFSVATCMMSDWVKSKPWLGLLGCVSAGLGVAASFGLCVYGQVDMIGINLAAPFLMLGVGMDDAFVLLAAWRRTSPTLSVSERMGHTYAEAAVSITITSVTNFISFMIGTITPFPSVRIFCIYTSVAVLLTYIYHITFFGGCMALFGHAEKRNLHGLVCVPVMPKSLATKKGFWFNLLCTGGINPDDPDNPKDNQEHMMMIFFRDVIAVGLNKTPIKILVIIVFLIYLAIGVWGCSMVKEGLDRRKLSRDDSYSVKFYDFEDRFFREYPYRIQVIINQTMNYADPVIQDKIERILTRFESSQYVANKNLTESWLRSYLSFINQEDSFLFLQALNLSNQDDFHTGLKSIFLHLPMTENFRHDIKFNEDGTEIIASRFVIQTHDIKDANEEKEMLIALREIADEFKDDHVSIFNHLFIFFDQFILVRGISLQTISVAALVMMGISLFFIPSPSCAIWVAFSIISIEIGVVGYMTHWGVNLDSISMINLIMCIGFSVDFSAHISYAYISCEEDNPADRVKSSLYSLGLPIFQGSVSTILGIVALAFAPSYVFLTFFKTVFLVMLFGALHGVLLLPVLLSLTDTLFNSKEHGKPRANSSGLVPIGQTNHGYVSKHDKNNKKKDKFDDGTTPSSSLENRHTNHYSNEYGYRKSEGNRNGNLSLSVHPFFNITNDKSFDGNKISILNKDGSPIYIPRPSLSNLDGEEKISSRMKSGSKHQQSKYTSNWDDWGAIVPSTSSPSSQHPHPHGMNLSSPTSSTESSTDVNNRNGAILMIADDSGSKSSSTSSSEGDLGIGTSSEEYSEGSWKELHVQTKSGEVEVVGRVVERTSRPPPNSHQQNKLHKRGTGFKSSDDDTLDPRVKEYPLVFRDRTRSSHR